MRIPRFAFALMLVMIALLSTGLVLVRARQVQPWWFELEIRFPNGQVISGIQNSTDLENKPTGLEFVQQAEDGELAYVIRVIDSRDGAEQIGIRAQKFPSNVDWHSAIQRLQAPQQVDWYVPGKKVRLSVPGYESLQITAQMLGEAPEHDASRESFLPKTGELRLMWPVLLRDRKFVGSLNGGTTYASDDYLAAFYVPGEGLFLVSPGSFEGAIEAKLVNSQIEFTSHGHSYLLLTGSPIVGGEQERSVWVTHLPNFKLRTSEKRDTTAVFCVKASEVAELSKR
jgi:hypothetical protein